MIIDEKHKISLHNSQKPLILNSEVDVLSNPFYKKIYFITIITILF